MKTCVYGGQFGSEGKGSIAEAVIKRYRSGNGKIGSTPNSYPAGEQIEKKLIVFGENSPNSGHTNSVGKTRNIPASAFFADAVVLGPDSVISPECLVEDLLAVTGYKASVGNDAPFMVYIHASAAISRPDHQDAEKDIVKRISSTGSGSGYSRFVKSFYRNHDAVVGNTDILLQAVTKAGLSCVTILNSNQYLAFVKTIEHNDWLFECSQGSLLDVNFGYYPFVTSRTTLPRVAIERNGLGGFDWEYIGVYRLHPIRTGGPSGPTGGPEITFESLGVVPEIATVTKRQRHIFAFSEDDFQRSLTLTRPDAVAFTHLDYINLEPENINGLLGALSLDESTSEYLNGCLIITSNKTGEAVFHE